MSPTLWLRNLDKFTQHKSFGCTTLSGVLPDSPFYTPITSFSNRCNSAGRWARHFGCGNLIRFRNRNGATPPRRHRQFSLQNPTLEGGGYFDSYQTAVGGGWGWRQVALNVCLYTSGSATRYSRRLPNPLIYSNQSNKADLVFLQ